MAKANLIARHLAEFITDTFGWVVTFISSLLKAILGNLQGFLIIGLVAYVFWEGLPFLRHTPFIEKVPYAGYVIEGRVFRYHREQMAVAIEKERRRAQKAKDDAVKEISDLERKNLEANEKLEKSLANEREALERAVEAESKKVETITNTVKVPHVRTVTLQCKKVENEPPQVLECPPTPVCPKIRISGGSCLNKRLPDSVSNRLFRRR